jgi:hypothetical protein
VQRAKKIYERGIKTKETEADSEAFRVKLEKGDEAIEREDNSSTNIAGGYSIYNKVTMYRRYKVRGIKSKQDHKDGHIRALDNKSLATKRSHHLEKRDRLRSGRKKPPSLQAAQSYTQEKEEQVDDIKGQPISSVFNRRVTIKTEGNITEDDPNKEEE